MCLSPADVGERVSHMAGIEMRTAQIASCFSFMVRHHPLNWRGLSRRMIVAASSAP